MVSERLINPIVWTGTKQDKLSNPYNGICAFEMNGDADNVLSYTTMLKKKYADEYYIMLPPVSANPPKVNFTAAGKIGMGSTKGWCIPKNGKNTLRTLAFVDYIMSDDFQKMNIFGREGFEYEIKNGMPALKPDVAATTTAGLSVMDKYCFNVLGGMIRNDIWKMVDRWQRMPEFVEGMTVLKPAIDRFHDLTLIPEAADVLYPADSEVLKIYSQIREVFGDELTKIIFGSQQNVEPAYKALLTRVESMGLQKLADFHVETVRNFSAAVSKYKK
jgi:spermidine/putrescine-binding protein